MNKNLKLEITYAPVEALVPYAGNAKLHGEADVAVIAESIERFGFDDPVGVWTNQQGETEIVEGHGRVLAAKRLGIESLPVIHLDHLTDEQRRAYTHVHNQTTLNSGFDEARLAAEMAELPEFDWGDFGFVTPAIEGSLPDFTHEDGFMYGQERLRTDRAYNLDIVSIADCGEDGMPLLHAVDREPTRLIGFNYAKTSDDKNAGIHFFVDDYQFERCWNDPHAYLDVLASFDCVLAPDFSLYMDMPYPMQQWNVYRSRALGNWWQRSGMTVIPTLSWSDRRSFEFAFSGLELGGTYAVSTVGVKGDDRALGIWRDGMAEAGRRLDPKRILLYGGDIGFDFGDIEVVQYRNEVTERMRNAGK